jgi:hypothetical protein
VEDAVFLEDATNEEVQGTLQNGESRCMQCVSKQQTATPSSVRICSVSISIPLYSRHPMAGAERVRRMHDGSQT